MSEIFDIEEVIRILGLEIRAEQADEGRNFDVACRVALNKLQKCKKYEELEEQGLLLRLPCKIGDTVYYPEKDYNFVYPIKISQIILSDLGEGKQCRQYNGCFFDCNGDPETEFEFDDEEFGKTVFLTQSEAEEKLKELVR